MRRPSEIALFDAIDDGDALAVRRILKDNPTLVEVTDQFGSTPLMCAASSMARTIDIIEAILEAGADVNRQTSEGSTALHCAIDVNGEANLNTEEIIRRLVKAGANLSLRQHYGWTPLLKSVVAGTLIELKTLLAVGAHPNDTLPLDTLPAFNAGRTALMAAITNPAAEEMIESLLEAGANPFARDLSGASFLDYAESTLRELDLRDSDSLDFHKKVQRCAEKVKEWVNRSHT